MKKPGECDGLLQGKVPPEDSFYSSSQENLQVPSKKLLIFSYNLIICFSITLNEEPIYSLDFTFNDKNYSFIHVLQVIHNALEIEYICSCQKKATNIVFTG